MNRSAAFLLAVAAMSAPAMLGQDSSGAAPNSAPASTFTQQQPAPIERGVPDYGARMGPNRRPRPSTTTSSPALGVYLRTSAGALVNATSDAHRLEINLDRGVANLNVHNPAPDKLILVDLHGGQTQVLENGLYTFNAETDTVRVLHGTADVFAAEEKSPTHVREGQQVAFNGSRAQVASTDPGQLRADLLPGSSPELPGRGGYGPYGDGFPGYAPGFYPYYAWGYPYYAWGYPGGWFGYPWGVGFGFGWGGWGGFRGGYGFGGFGRGFGFRGRT